MPNAGNAGAGAETNSRIDPFPEGARSYRFNDTRLPKKKKKTLEVTKLTSCMDFRMIQAAIKNVLKDQQLRELGRIRTTCTAVYLYDNINNRIYNKILDRDWFSARLFVT